MLKVTVAACAGLALAGCGTTTIARYPAPPDEQRSAKQKLVVVIDGTSNDARDRTNASRIHELVSNQNRPNLSVFYTEGVGSDARIGGMATGWGMAKDVRDAYRYLAETWRPGDGISEKPGEIFLFGFSRGAFGGRILTGLIYAAGLIDFRPDKQGQYRHSLKQRQAIVDDLYDAYKTPRETPDGLPIKNPTPGDRGKAARAVIDAADVELSGQPTIKAVGYWDTVGAMGFPDGTIDPFGEEKEQYLDQFCNVEKVFHAMSLDDNRAYDFTPLLASGPLTFEPCLETDTVKKVDEVWFSGAHADVGGAYSSEMALEGHLPGVSLNWMIARINEIDPDLLPRGAGQYANPYDMVHDSQLGLAVWRVRPRAFRDVLGWSRASAYNDRRPKIHISVAQRFAMLFEIEKAFSPQCTQPREEPALLCAAELTQEDRRPTPFLAALIKDDCAERHAGTDPATKRRFDGYILVGKPVAVEKKREATLGCVTLSFDTIAQRDAYLVDGVPPAASLSVALAKEEGTAGAEAPPRP